MLYDIVFNYMLIYHLVYSILFSFSTECILFGLMLDCIIEETTVIVYFSKTEEHKRQQIATGEENKEGGEGRKKKKKVTLVEQLMCAALEKWILVQLLALISFVPLPILLSEIFHKGSLAATSFNFPGTWSETLRPHLQKCWAPRTEENGQHEVNLLTVFRYYENVDPQYLKLDIQKLTCSVFLLQKPCFVICIAIL